MSFKFVLSDDRATVRMFARDNMRDSKVSNPACWFPEDGYRMFAVEDAQPLVDTPLLVVPPRPIDTAPLRATVSEYVKWEAMSVGQETMWEVDLDRMEQAAEEQCATCADLRAQEVVTNTVKTDTTDEKNVKKAKRRLIHKELAAHLDVIRAADEDTPGHAFVSIRSLLGPALPADGEHKQPPVQVVPDPVDDAVDEDQAGGKKRRRKPKDARNLVVGRVPVHMRTDLVPVAEGDFIFFRYGVDGQEDGAGGGVGAGSERDDLLGVACVLLLPTAENPALYKVHWYGHEEANKGSNSLAWKFKAMWVQPARVVSGSSSGRKKKKKKKRKAQATEERRYYADKPLSRAHFARTQTLKITKNMLVCRSGKLNAGGALPVKIKRYLCSAAQLPHKIKDHGENCTCIWDDS